MAIFFYISAVIFFLIFFVFFKHLFVNKIQNSNKKNIFKSKKINYINYNIISKKNI